MSVYTPLSHDQLAQLLGQYGYQLLAYQAASHGIENSTFLIQAEDQQQQPCDLVLTVFEQLSPQQLTPYLQLLRRLHERGLPVPTALLNRQQQPLSQVAGKAAVLMPRLPGEHRFQITADHCRQIGTLLAQLHTAPCDGLLPLPDERQRLQRLAAQLNKLPGEEQPVAAALLQRWQALPAGDTLIHGDLFRDNVLWQGQQVSALLDFYNACLELREYDLAVTLNDWCVSPQGQPCADAEHALLQGYRDGGGHYQPAQLALALPVAALRFWLSRLSGPVAEQSEGMGSKDPDEFARIYRQRLVASEHSGLTL